MKIAAGTLRFLPIFFFFFHLDIGLPVTRRKLMNQRGKTIICSTMRKASHIDGL